jgi:hypothetical protein
LYLLGIKVSSIALGKEHHSNIYSSLQYYLTVSRFKAIYFNHFNMQFTIAAILAMAMAVSASPLEVRQSGPTGPIPAGTVYVYNYQSTTGDGGCRPSDFKGLYATITEDDTGACHNITLPAGTTSNDIEANVNRPSE